MGETLVICVGNVARGDDGVAHTVAGLVEASGCEGVEIVTATALDVSMAEDIARAALVVFVDAERRSEPPVEMLRVEPAPGPMGPHSAEPATLLDLAARLYGASPAAWIVSIAAPEMDHGEGLSETAAAGAEEAARRMVRLLA